MKAKDEVIIGKCPECNRPIYKSELTGKIRPSCRVHPCIAKEELEYRMIRV